jgi:hypothetical protein
MMHPIDSFISFNYNFSSHSGIYAFTGHRSSLLAGKKTEGLS